MVSMNMTSPGWVGRAAEYEDVGSKPSVSKTKVKFLRKSRKGVNKQPMGLKGFLSLFFKDYILNSSKSDLGVTETEIDPSHLCQTRPF